METSIIIIIINKYYCVIVNISNLSIF
uniref:Uncharacterized protein n=1 Tax=Moumouvirus sp. 'Monve' TaxID=1128131 RepID=H2EEH1_9VIRU|nr:hypothetical protein mv_L589 [Moumouvirus Monve]